MGQLLSYSINVAILLLPIYLVYKWLLSHETFHAFNRVVILMSYVVVLAFLPVMSLIEYIEQLSIQSTQISSVHFDIAEIMKMSDITEKIQTPYWAVILLCVYILGCAVLTARLIYIWYKITHLIVLGEKKQIGKYKLIITNNEKVAPFSWMRYIVMSQDDYNQAGNIIITHEKQHLHCCHWIDLLIAEMVIIINWFNPAAWLMREELKTVHEYQADMAVLKSGADAKNYQLLLIKKAVGARFPSLANSLNHSKLKKRITMMLSKSSRKSSRLRALAIVPAIFAALLVVNQSSVASTISVIGNSDLPLSHDKDNEKSKNLTGTPTKISVKNVSKTEKHNSQEKLEIIDYSSKEDLTESEYYINAKKSTKEKFEELPDSVIEKSIIILDGKTKIVSAKTGQTQPEKDPVVYIDGKESSMNVLTSIKPERIKDMRVEKKDGDGIIYVTLKPQQSQTVETNKKYDSSNISAYYVNDKEVSEEDINKIDPSNIKSMEIIKEGDNKIVKVTLK